MRAARRRSGSRSRCRRSTRPGSGTIAVALRAPQAERPPAETPRAAAGRRWPRSGDRDEARRQRRLKDETGSERVDRRDRRRRRRPPPRRTATSRIASPPSERPAPHARGSAPGSRPAAGSGARRRSAGGAAGAEEAASWLGVRRWRHRARDAPRSRPATRCRRPRHGPSAGSGIPAASAAGDVLLRAVADVERLLRPRSAASSSAGAKIAGSGLRAPEPAEVTTPSRAPARPQRSSTSGSETSQFETQTRRQARARAARPAPARRRHRRETGSPPSSVSTATSRPSSRESSRAQRSRSVGERRRVGALVGVVAVVGHLLCARRRPDAPRARCPSSAARCIHGGSSSTSVPSASRNTARVRHQSRAERLAGSRPWTESFWDENEDWVSGGDHVRRRGGDRLRRRPVRDRARAPASPRGSATASRSPSRAAPRPGCG